MASNLEFVKNVNFNTSPSSSTLVIDEVFTDRYDSYFVIDPVISVHLHKEKVEKYIFSGFLAAKRSSLFLLQIGHL